MQIKAPHPFCVTEYTCTWHNARTKVDKISPSGKTGPQKAHLILQACDSWHKPLIFLIIPAQLFLQIYGALMQLSDRLPQLIHIAGWCGLSRYSHLPLWRTNGNTPGCFFSQETWQRKAWLDSPAMWQQVFCETHTAHACFSFWDCEPSVLEAHTHC